MTDYKIKRMLNELINKKDANYPGNLIHQLIKLSTKANSKKLSIQNIKSIQRIHKEYIETM